MAQALHAFGVMVTRLAREIREYLKRNRWVVGFALGLVFMTYFIKLSNYSVSIDNEVALNDFDGLRKSWITIGRWALALMSYVINYTGYNPFFSTLVMVILFLTALLLLSFYLSKLTHKLQYEKAVLMIIGATCLTSPVFATMFNFSMQGIEVAFGLITAILAAMFLDIAIHSDRKSCRKIIYVLAVVLLTFSMGVYQSLAMVFITIVAIFFLVRQIFNKHNDHLRVTIIRIAKILGVFVVAYLINVLISKIVMSVFGLEKTDYLTSQIMWGKSFKDSIKSIIIFVKCVVFPRDSLTGAYNYAYLYAVLLSIILIIALFRRLGRKAILAVLCIIVVLTSPFLMVLLGGNGVPVRSMLNLPLTTGAILCVFYCMGLKGGRFRGVLFVMTFLIGATQFRTTVDLFNSDLVRYEEDKTLLQSVFSRIEALGLLSDIDGFFNKTITFSGKHEILSTGANASADAMTASFFSWDNTSPLESNYRINGFAKTLGYKYIQPNVDDVERAHGICAESVKYPTNGSIKNVDGNIVVCLE